MSVFEAIYTRRSVREFASEGIDDGTLSDLLDAAVQAPNAMNRQLWRFVVVSNPAVLRRIGRAAKALVLERLDSTPELAALKGHLSEPGFDIFYGAPMLVVIWTTGADEMSVHDCCLAAQNLMLAATIKGLGSCWIGLAEAWLATTEAKQELGIDRDGRPVAPIILGRPQRLPPAPGRAPPRISWIR